MVAKRKVYPSEHSSFIWKFKKSLNLIDLTVEIINVKLNIDYFYGSSKMFELTRNDQCQTTEH